MASEQIESASVERTATGPRKPQGNERSKHNVLNHGIFSIEEHVPAKFVNKPNTRPSPSTDSDPTVANGADVMSAGSPLQEQPVDFVELEDGTLVEMIEDPHDPGNSIFAIYKGGEVWFAGTVKRGNLVLAPFPRQDGIFKHVRLARGTQPYRSVELLLRGIADVILGCVDIDLSDLTLVATFVVSTWFIESLPVAPYLALVGLPRSGKTTLLQVLNLLCRRPLFTSDITSAAFYDVYEKLTPTLLVDETLTAGNKRALFHLLKTGTTRGSVTLRRGRSLKAFGPKVMSWIELPNDPALNSRCVIIPMQETSRTDLAKPTDKRILDSADVLRMQLLQFRFENFKSLRLSKVPGDERLHSRTRDLYQTFALPLGSDADICKTLVRLFEDQEEIHREALTFAAAAVLRVLYDLIHAHLKDGKCSNKDLTEVVNSNLERRQEPFRLNAHQVGRVLTSLGLTARKRTSAGFVLYVDLRTAARIHKLGNDYGIAQESQFRGKGFGDDCELCRNLRAPSPPTETKGDSGMKSK